MTATQIQLHFGSRTRIRYPNVVMRKDVLAPDIYVHYARTADVDISCNSTDTLIEHVTTFSLSIDL